MENIQEIKFSMIGNYENLIATPENFDSLGEFIKKYKLLPNQLTIHTIDKNSIKLVQRIKLESHVKKFRIEILPDRIDFIYNKKTEFDTFNYDDIVKELINLASDLDGVFNVNVNRIAILIGGVFKNEKHCKLFENNECLNIENAVEWDVRFATREKFVTGNQLEDFNISILLRKSEFPFSVEEFDKVNTYTGVQFLLDINTLVNLNKLYSMKNITDFLRNTAKATMKSYNKIREMYQKNIK